MSAGKDEIIKPDAAPAAKICPEFPAQLSKNGLGQIQLMGGISCIGETCAKFQCCQVLPATMAAILETLRERLP